MSNLETDPEKILAANIKRHEKAMEFDELFRENSVVNIMSAQIHDLQKDRDRLYRRVQNLEKLIMDMVESRLDKAEAEVFGTPLDKIDPKWVTQGGH